MTEREALNMALQALETLMIERGSIYDKAITAIKEALEQPEQHQDWCASLTQMLMSMPPKPAPCNCKPKPEQKPVACVTYKEVADTMNGLWGGTLVQRQIAEELENTMLYTTPPHRTWVGLTDEEIKKIVGSDRYTDLLLEVVKVVEAKLKEKNT